ncbi:MAG TPA: cupin domain-containing protein [Silvibacterium sp.]|jgi:mannose-6-phosphate isomerase-like protein (cupin superfamily)|nr:cupin domain-containing protein [Silvibacterium sp.]
MKHLSRRDLCSALPALALLGAVIPETALAGAQTTPATSTLPAESTAFSFDKLPVTRSPNGAATRPVLRGVTPTGEAIELHETTLMPGQMPHPAHKHLHTELMLIREGTVEFITVDKTGGDRSEQVGPGGVCYAASNTMHALKNVGSEPANYFVIAIGTEPSHG